MGKDEETIGDSKGLSASMRNVISIRRVGLLLLLTGGLEHEFYVSIQLGMSSSQLTFTNMFQRGVKKTPTSLEKLVCPNQEKRGFPVWWLFNRVIPPVDEFLVD